MLLLTAAKNETHSRNVTTKKLKDKNSMRNNIEDTSIVFHYPTIARAFNRLGLPFHQCKNASSLFGIGDPAPFAH